MEFTAPGTSKKPKKFRNIWAVLETKITSQFTRVATIPRVWPISFWRLSQLWRTRITWCTHRKKMSFWCLTTFSNTISRSWTSSRKPNSPSPPFLFLRNCLLVRELSEMEGLWLRFGVSMKISSNRNWKKKPSNWKRTPSRFQTIYLSFLWRNWWLYRRLITMSENTISKKYIKILCTLPCKMFCKIFCNNWVIKNTP